MRYIGTTAKTKVFNFIKRFAPYVVYNTAAYK